MSKLPQKQENNLQYLLSIVAIIACAALLVTYLFLHKSNILQGSGLGNFLGEVLPDLFAAAAIVVLVYFVFKRKGIDSDTSMREAIVENKKLLHKLSEEINIAKDQLRINNDMYNLLDRQSIRYKEVIKFMINAKPLAKELGNWMLQGYLSKFEPIKKGIKIKDEYLALYSYVLFWEHLAELQKKRAINKEECIIARVIHSNTIHIWTNDHDKYKELSVEIYKMKKQFIDNGGIIVRIIIGKEDEANSDVKKAIEEMERCGIEAKYLKKSQRIKLQYDFLLLHDEDFFARWKSDNYGEALSECEYVDSADKEISKKWQELFFALKDKGTPITSIPKNREFFITD